MFATKASRIAPQHCPKCNRKYADLTLRFCLYDGASLIKIEALDNNTEILASQPAQNTVAAHAFISYKRSSNPDEQVAREVCNALGQHHDVFIDQKISVGTRWAHCIEAELRRSDFLIVFLSEKSINSEMVWGEIKMAHQLAKEKKGRPAILPVRLDYFDPFPYPLNTILDEIQWLVWRGPEDTRRVITELKLVLDGDRIPTSPKAPPGRRRTDETTLPLPLPQAQPITLKPPAGKLDWHSKYYVTRDSDAIGESAIEPEGVTITIKGPRQMGKTSLLNRLMDSAKNLEKRVVFLDFQLLDKVTLSRAELFYPHFCSWLTDKLELDDRVDEWWNRRSRPPNQHCTAYVSEYVLKEISAPLLLAMDEVDRVAGADFRDDFFGMLRHWHGERTPDSPWDRLDLVLVTSTEPYQLIEDLTQSPFNVGETIEVEDFNAQQLSELNGQYGSPINPRDEERLMALLSGHPYLTHRAIYLVASGRLNAPDLFQHAASERGPFGDHLRHHLFRLNERRDLIDALRKVTNRGTSLDERTFFRLRGPGLVKRQGRTVVPRCQLYAEYFKEYL